MKYFLKFVTIDPLVKEKYPKIKSIQGWQSWKPHKDDESLAHGPGNSRIQIVDRNEESPFEIMPGLVPKIDLEKSRVTFDIGKGKQINHNKLRQLSVFSTALKVIDMYEGPDALGRRISWSFDNKPLKIFIRHSNNTNAQYFRQYQQIRLCYFDSDEKRIYAASSPDIVAHEMSHAILDGIAPDLLDCALPDTLAIHEAIADLTALFLSFEMDDFTDHLLEKTNGDLYQANEFGWIAEQFGKEVAETGNKQYLRSLYSDFSLNEEWGTLIDDSDHYPLSQVFSGAVFSALITEFEREEGFPGNEEQGKGLSLFIAARKARRMLCRGLDYLPPGEVTLFDLAYSIILADRFSFPKITDGHLRKSLVEEFIKRGIGNSHHEFEFHLTSNIDISGIDLDLLVKDKDYIIQFIQQNKDNLYIPHDEFKIRSPVKTKKIRFLENSQREELSELIIKISWYEEITLDESIDDADSIFVKFGTTVVFDLINRKLLCMQSTSRLGSEINENNFQKSQINRLNLVKQLINSDDFKKVDSFGLADEISGEYKVENKVIKVKMNGMGLHKCC